MATVSTAPRTTEITLASTSAGPFLVGFRLFAADGLDELRDYFKSRNGSLMTLYFDVGAASQFGTWGAKTHLADTSPIWNGLLSWHAANPRWWAQ